MKVQFHLLQGAVLCALALSQTAIGSAGVFKCVGADGSTTYQSDPCNASTTETRLDIAAAMAGAPIRAAVQGSSQVAPPSVKPATAPAIYAASSRVANPWGRRTLALGMSDDEVLNLPGWGRPSSVTRARMPHAWHEDWVYRTTSGAGERRLHFVNMRLVSVDVEPAGESIVHVAGQ